MPLDGMFGRRVPNWWELGPREGVAPEWTARAALPVNRLREGQIYVPSLPASMQREVDDRARLEYFVRINPLRYLDRHGHIALLPD